MDTGIDWDALKEELEEFEQEEDAFDSYSLTDYMSARKPMPVPEETTKVDISDTVAVGYTKEKSEDEIKFGDVITDKDVMENSSILYPEKRVYRSILLETFTPERCIELEKLSRTFSISNNRKVDIIKEKFNSWGIEYAPLGPGTNRYAFMKDGYVIKLALDKDGKIDNKREFIYSLPLQPYVIKCYETFADGLLAVFEYVEIFTIDDFYKNQGMMREMLSDIAANFLIGDVGISSVNYVNWGFRDDGSLVILDYAYIYSVAFKKFTCNCSPQSVLHYDRDFNNLVCPVCGKKYDFKTIRKKISRKDQDDEIGDLMEKGYVLYSPEQYCDFNPKFVYGAFDAIFKKLIKIKKKQNERLTKSIHKSKSLLYPEPMSIEEILEQIKNGGFES